MKRYSDGLPYTTIDLMYLYAEMCLFVPKFQLPYFKTHDAISTTIIRGQLVLSVFMTIDREMLDADNNVIKPVDINLIGDTRVNVYELNVHTIIQAMQKGEAGYFVKIGDSIREFWYGVYPNGSLLYDDRRIMGVEVVAPSKRAKFDTNLLQKFLSHNEVSFLPYRLMSAYTDATFRINKKMRLPIITVKNCIRNLPVPYNGVNDILVAVSKGFVLHNHLGEAQESDSKYYGVISSTKPVVFRVGYWDFFKAILLGLDFKFVNNDTGEVLPFKDAIHRNAIMFYRGRTTNTIRTLFISLDI